MWVLGTQSCLVLYENTLNVSPPAKVTLKVKLSPHDGWSPSTHCERSAKPEQFYLKLTFLIAILKVILKVIITCGCFVCIYVCVRHALQNLRRPEEDIRVPGTRITDSCVPLWRCWQLKPGPLEMQPVPSPATSPAPQLTAVLLSYIFFPHFGDKGDTQFSKLKVYTLLC